MNNIGVHFWVLKRILGAGNLLSQVRTYIWRTGIYLIFSFASLEMEVNPIIVAFSHIRTKYGEIRSISPYSVRMWENTDQNNTKYGHFSGSYNWLVKLVAKFSKKWNLPHRLHRIRHVRVRNFFQKNIMTSRSSHRKFCKKGCSKACNVIKKTLQQRCFSCEISEIFKSTFVYRAPPMTATVNLLYIFYLKFNSHAMYKSHSNEKMQNLTNENKI